MSKIMKLGNTVTCDIDQFLCAKSFTRYCLPGDHNLPKEFYNMTILESINLHPRNIIHSIINMRNLSVCTYDDLVFFGINTIMLIKTILKENIVTSGYYGNFSKKNRGRLRNIQEEEKVRGNYRVDIRSHSRGSSRTYYSVSFIKIKK